MPPTDPTPNNDTEPANPAAPVVTPEPAAAPQVTPEPAAPAGPVQPLNITPLPSEPAKNKSRLFKPSKKILIPIAAVLLLAGGSPDIKTLEDKLNKSIANQWISVDSTLVSQAKLSCLSGFPGSFSQSDIDTLKTSYRNSPFATITSHSADTVGGQKATKFVLKLDDNNLSRVNLSGSSYFNRISGCLKQSNPSSKLDLSSLKDSDSTPVTLWVDSASKRIVKYSSQSTAKDKQKGTSGDLSGTITYGAVNITPPSGAKPVLNVISNLGLGGLIKSLNGTGSPNSTSTGNLNILHN
jgi:hypothetical protein